MVERSSNHEGKENELHRKCATVHTCIYKSVANTVAFLLFMHSTFRKDCCAELSLRASEDGLLLMVRSFNINEHNHPISRVMLL